MAKAVRIKCVFLNVGAGPLRHSLSKFFVTRALFAADYVSFRDEQSQALAMDIGFRGKSQSFSGQRVQFREKPRSIFPSPQEDEIAR